MTEHAGSHHDWHTDSYVQDWIDNDTTHDQRRRARLRDAAALLPLSRSRPVRVLDVGGGYGEFTAQVLAEFPLAVVCLQDFSAPMITHARTRLAEFGERVDYRLADLRDPRWVEQLEGPFDAVVSALTIHNLGEPDAIRAAYAHIKGLLRPGGWFFDLVLVLDVALSPPNSPLSRLYAHADGAQERDHHAHDHYDNSEELDAPSLEQRLGWLRDAGFDHVDCIQKNLSQVFLVGNRTT